ncbi:MULTISPECIES: glycoside hydrolase family 3 protein [unclassified Francisella]|uniref:glycoside hydrolase family 3 protein n=1 Tax=unclassified Francisella TaxID=2610885 RepID=UPI002E361BAC|nr:MULTISPECIES: glycoside hydrolase family 3 protein [unclassified Francisella]MED7818436.1 glycoside hydrolase family 3 protein [Francisella sp. 19S2-4]MED7829309.1 glycoside hydrolase family 3 protein [Francisella sp. 19S2-10]
MSISIRRKLGQLIMMDFRYWGEDLDNKPLAFTKTNQIINKLFKDYNLSGFILFKENIETNEQTISLLRGIQSNVTIPLFFGIDQEGGRVNRIKQGTSGCGNMALAATKNPENAYTMAKLIGDELYSLGINTNFAPVVDVNSNKNNPIIGVRSYSDNPETVIEYAKSAIDGYHEAKIIDCVKHFPGHGDTSSDSHLGSVSVNKSLAELEKTELLPFQKLVSKYNMVMSAHISMPALDDSIHKSVSTGQDIGIPATLSHNIITKFLKEKIGFKGLVVSDAMDMKAIATHFGSIEATKLAILAGIDIVLMPVRIWSEKDAYKLEELFRSLENEYIENTAFALAVDMAYSKVLEFKQKHNLYNSHIYKLSQNEQVKVANLVVNSKKHQKISLDIAKQSTTVVKNSGIIPYQLEDKQSILIIDSDRQRLSEFCEILKQIISSQKLNIDVIVKHINDELEIDIHSSDLVLLVSESLKKYSHRHSTLTSIAPEKTINIAALTPYDIDYIKNVQNYICIYGATSIDQTNYTVTSLKINIQAALENIFCN